VNGKSILVVLGLALLAPPSSLTETTIPARIYSNVEYFEEGGDLVGFELSLRVQGSVAHGEFRDYEGGCGIKTEIVGTMKGRTIQLRGKSDTSQLGIDGRFDGGVLNATIKIGANAELQKVRLKPIPSPHC